MVPVYGDLSDRLASPYGEEDWYEERQSWKWINTIMRVNSLVQKVRWNPACHTFLLIIVQTVVLVYITIPALSSFPEANKSADGTLDPRKNDMASLLRRYSVREVTLVRCTLLPPGQILTLPRHASGLRADGTDPSISCDPLSSCIRRGCWPENQESPTFAHVYACNPSPAPRTQITILSTVKSRHRPAGVFAA